MVGVCLSSVDYLKSKCSNIIAGGAEPENILD